MKKVALIFGLVLSMAMIGIGQVRTVTNSTLQKFQQKRLAADRDYRENYARLGFPSPEELDRQRESELAARLSIVEQLREARVANERLELERRNLDIEAASIDNAAARVEESRPNGVYFGTYGGYFGNYRGGSYPYGYYRRYRGYFPKARIFSGGGYRATPVGVYPNPSPRMRPIISRGGPRGGTLIRSGRH
ncbi:MAG: hypothetical protein ABI857_09330 [Acidobacteriota bacterium]